MFVVWLPVLAYVVLIFTLSSIPDLAPPKTISHLDKLAHFLEYSVMGLLLARAFSSIRSGRMLQWAGLSVVTGGGIAAMDEVYQGTVGRHQSTADWIFDSLGLVTAILVMVWLSRRKQKSTKKGDRW